MVIKHCGYWQTNISSYLHTDLNANVFTRGSRKGLGQKSAQLQDFKDQPNLGA